MSAESIEYTGRNGAEVRDWTNADPGCDETSETWFMTKGMSAATGGQAWNYAKGEQHWPQDVRACAYDARTGTWLPVRVGDVIERRGTGLDVRSAS